MPSHDPERLFRRLVENPKAPQSARLKALRFLSKPSYALLRRLVTNPNTPGRVAALAAQIYARRYAEAQTPAQRGNMPKELTVAQLEQIFGKPKPLPENTKPEDYGPALDESLEAFFSNVGRPARCDYDTPWPPAANPATDLYLRLNGAVLFGAGEPHLSELPRFLSCLQRTRSDVVRDRAFRAVLYSADELRAHVPRELLLACLNEIETRTEFHNQFTPKYIATIKETIQR